MGLATRGLFKKQGFTVFKYFFNHEALLSFKVILYLIFEFSDPPNEQTYIEILKHFILFETISLTVLNVPKRVSISSVFTLKYYIYQLLKFSSFYA